MYPLHKFYCSFQNHRTIYPENDWKFKNSDQFEFYFEYTYPKYYSMEYMQKEKKKIFLVLQ